MAGVLLIFICFGALCCLGFGYALGYQEAATLAYEEHRGDLAYEEMVRKQADHVIEYERRLAGYWEAEYKRLSSSGIIALPADISADDFEAIKGDMEAVLRDYNRAVNY